MKTNKIITVSEYNATQTSQHMMFNSKRGYVVTDGDSAIYCKSIAIAQNQVNIEFEPAKNELSYAEAELDWAVEHSAVGLTHNMISK